MQRVDRDDVWKAQEASAVRERDRLLKNFGRGAWANPDPSEDEFVYFDFINNDSAGRVVVKTL